MTTTASTSDRTAVDMQPATLLRVLNSGEYGEVMTRKELSRERDIGSARIGTGSRINFFLWTAWRADVLNKKLAETPVDASGAATGRRASYGSRSILFKRAAKTLRPKQQVNLDGWCEDNRIMVAPDPFPGLWQTSRTPAAREIMRAITDPLVREVVVVTVPQFIKTELLINTALYHVAYQPSSMLTVTAGGELMEELAVRINRAINHCPAAKPEIHEALSWRKSKEEKDKTALRTFKNGAHLSIVNGYGKSAGISRPVLLVMIDELDEINVPKLLHKLKHRTRAFAERSKILMVSTPADASQSVIWGKYLEGSRHVRNLKCPSCGLLQKPDWTRVSSFNEGVRYSCLGCQARWDDNARLNAEIHGEYVCENPNATEIKSFQINGLCSPNLDLESMHAEWERAQADILKENDYDRMSIFWSSNIGEPFSQSVGRINLEAVTAMRRNYTSAALPDSVDLLTMGVDVQDDRFEYEIAGWGWDLENGRMLRWAVEYGKIIGDFESSATFSQLTPLFRTPRDTLKKKNGTQLLPSVILIDSGSGPHTHHVYRYVIAMQRVIGQVHGREAQTIWAAKSSSKRIREPIVRGTPRQDPDMPEMRRNILKIVGSESCKSRILKTLSSPPTNERPAAWVWPRKGGGGVYDDARYWRGLCSEERVSTFNKRARDKKWVYSFEQWDKAVGNEPIDVMMLTLAGVELISADTLRRRAELKS